MSRLALSLVRGALVLGALVRGVVLLGGLLLVAASAGAQLPTPWAAVGRVDVADTHACTGTVVGPKEVLTAAHCLFDPDTGVFVAIDDIVFRAGLWGREVQALQKPVAVRLRHDYVGGDPNALAVLERDVAVLVFAEPLGVKALGLAPANRAVPDFLTAVRYGKSRPTRTRVDHGCGVVYRVGGLWQLSCKGEAGNSGAPLLAPSPDGPEVVGVVVAVRVGRSAGHMLAVPLEGGRVLPTAADTVAAQGGAVAAPR